MSTSGNSSSLSSGSEDTSPDSGSPSDSSEQDRRGSSKTLAKTNHLVLMVGHSVLQAFSTSTFALTYLREHELNPVPNRVIDCASSTATHSCVKRSFAKNFEACLLFEEMPNVTKLEVIAAPAELHDERIDDTVVHSISSLLAHWSKSLATLKLVFQYEPSSYGSLLEAINGLSEIRHLTLEIDQQAVDANDEEEGSKSSSSDVADNKKPPTEEAAKDGKELVVKLDLPDLPVLAKLEEFFYRAPVITSQLVHNLKKYGSSLKRIGLGNDRGFKGTHIEMMISSVDKALASRFVYVPPIKRPFSEQQLLAFFSAFNGITSLTLDAAQLSLLTLSTALAPLHALLYLRLTNAFFHLGRPLSADDSTPAEQVRSLASVKSLTLEIFAKSHVFLQSVHWGHVFPELTEAKVTNHRTNCALCEGQSRCSFTKPPPETRVNCTRQLMEPLKQCPQLVCTYPVNIIAPAEKASEKVADTAGASKCCKH